MGRRLQNLSKIFDLGLVLQLWLLLAAAWPPRMGCHGSIGPRSIGRLAIESAQLAFQALFEGETGFRS